MKKHWFPITLTIINLTVLAFALGETGPAEAQNVPAVVRARAFELVDESGRVRATLNIQPPTKANGETYPESVLLRLITERGRPAVKISTSEAASGLSFAGPTGTKDTYVVLEAKGNSSTLTLKNENGRQQTLTP